MQYKITFPEKMPVQKLAEVAQMLNLFIVYVRAGEYELVEADKHAEILAKKEARLAELKKELEERRAKLNERKKSGLNNVYPLPIKPKKTSIFRKTLFNFTGPGAA